MAVDHVVRGLKAIGDAILDTNNVFGAGDAIEITTLTYTPPT